MKSKNYFFLKILALGVLGLFLLSCASYASAATYRVSYRGASFNVNSLNIRVEWNAIGPGSYAPPFFQLKTASRLIRWPDGHYPGLALTYFSANLEPGENDIWIHSNHYQCDDCYDGGTPCPCDAVYAKITFANGRALYTSNRWGSRYGGEVISCGHSYGGRYIETRTCSDCCETNPTMAIFVSKVNEPRNRNGGGGVSEVNNAACKGITAPSSVSASQSFGARVVMKNTGTETWSRSKRYRLGSQDPPDNGRWGLKRVGLPTSYVRPGQSAAFNFTARAPASPGTYPFSWKMIEEGVEWFGSKCWKRIAVTAPRPTCSASLSPSEIKKGENATLSISSENCSSASYTCSGSLAGSAGSAPCNGSVTVGPAKKTGEGSCTVTVRGESGLSGTCQSSAIRVLFKALWREILPWFQ